MTRFPSFVSLSQNFHSSFQSMKGLLFKLGVWKVVILMIGFGTMFSMTIKDLAPLLNEYYDSDLNTAVKIEVVTNESERPPILDICIPFSPVALQNLLIGLQQNESQCEICQALNNMGWNVWTASIPGDNNLESLLKKFMWKVFEDGGDVLNVNNSDWNLPIVDAVFEYFASAMIPDEKIIQSWIENPSALVSDGIGYPDLEKTQMDALFRQLITFICHHIQFYTQKKVYWTPTPKPDGYCVQYLIESAVELLSHLFCVYMPSTMERIGISVNSGSLQYDNNSNEWEFVPENGSRWPSFDSPGAKGYERLISDEDSSDDLYIRHIDGHETGEVVIAFYSIEFNVVEERKRPCFRGETQRNCVTKCNTWKVVELCHCIPFFYKTLLRPQRNWYEHLPYCNSSLYLLCASEFEAKAVKECKDKCKTACEYSSYKWMMISTHPPGLQGWNVEMRRNGGDQAHRFVQFTLIPKHTPEILMSQIGGIGGLYLGISGLSIIGFLALLVEQVKKWWRKKYGFHEAKEKSKHGSETTGGISRDEYLTSLKDIKNWMEIMGGTVARMANDMKQMKESMPTKL